MNANTFMQKARTAGLALLAALALVFALGALAPRAAFAEAFDGGYEWSVNFDGNTMSSTYDNYGFEDAMVNMQPGDTVTLRVHCSSSFDQTTAWYLNNEALKTLEEQSARGAESGVYSYKLTYTNQSGQENVLFDSTTLGGTAPDGTALQGLHQATDSLDQWIYLDDFAPGQTGTVDLVIALDGETQGNAYQDTLGQVKLAFATEYVGTDANIVTHTDQVTNTNNTTGTSSTGNTTSSGGSTSGSLPKTADLLNILPLLAGALCTAMFARSLRRDMVGKEGSSNE